MRVYVPLAATVLVGLLLASCSSTSKNQQAKDKTAIPVTDADEQLKLRDRILAHSWSVRATEADVKTRRPVGATPRRLSAELAAVEQALQRALQTRVRIVGNDRRGRIEIVYATPEELERLGGLLGG